MGTVLISKKSLGKLARTAKADEPLTDGQRKAIREAEIAIGKKKPDCPLNQGHGKTLDDYEKIGEPGGKFRVFRDNDTVTSEVVTASGFKDAKEKSKYDSPNWVTRIRRNNNE